MASENILDGLTFLEPPKEGVQVRVNHTDCSAGRDTKRRLYIKKVPHGYVAHCFNCGKSGWRIFKGGRSVTVDSIKKDNDILTDSYNRDASCTLEMFDKHVGRLPLADLEMKAWLYKHHMTDEDIVEMNLSQTNDSVGLVIPHMKLTAVVTRYFGDALGGKYKIWDFSSGKAARVFPYQKRTPLVSKGLPTVITEDCISAYRVSKSDRVNKGTAALGTNLSKSTLEYFSVTTDRPIIVWFDDDLAGRKAAAHAIKKLQFRCPNRRVGYANAPEAKKLSPEEIEDVLKTGITY